MKTLFAFLSFFLFFIGCKDTGPGIDLNNSNRYPAQLNNLWEYHTVYVTEYYDTLGNIEKTETNELVNTIAQVKKINDALPGFTNLTLFEMYDVDNPENIQRAWYQNTNDEFLAVAYSNAGTASPVHPKIIAAQKYLTFKDFTEILKSDYLSLPVNAAYSESDSVQYYDIPRRVLAYPLTSGRKWVELTTPWYRERIVEKVMTINVNEVNYTCYKIIVNWPGYNIEFNDYISTTAGLVKREVISDSLIFSDPENPMGNGRFIKITSVSNLVRKNF